MEKLNEREQSVVVDNMKLVYRIVSQFGITQGNPEYDDIVQEGCLALMYAAQHYDEAISRFSTYACACIFGRINEYLRKKRISESRLPVISLESTIPDSENLTYADSIPDKFSIDDGILSLELFGICNRAIRKMPSEKSRNIAFSYLMEAVCGGIPRMRSISKRFGVTNQWISSVIKKYRRVLSAELKGSGYNVPVGKRLEN